jgi:hypothetical protein
MLTGCTKTSLHIAELHVAPMINSVFDLLSSSTFNFGPIVIDYMKEETTNFSSS